MQNNATDFDHRRLIGAVVVETLKQARRGDLAALAWLISDGRTWAAALGLDVTTGALLAWHAESRKTNLRLHK